MTPFRFLPHTADIQVELTAPDLAGLYQAGADAVRDLLVGSSPVAPAEQRTVALAGRAEGDRLLDFLRELVYLYDTERFLPAAVRLNREAGSATVTGEPLDASRHAAVRELKGVTYHGFTFAEGPEQARALVIFDV